MLPKLSTRSITKPPLDFRTNAGSPGTRLPPTALPAPILGNYGSFYSAKTQKPKVNNPKPKTTFGKSEEPLPIHLPPLVYPPKHDGFYNLMWDPRICRGSSLVRFQDLANRPCDNKTKRNRNSSSSNSNREQDSRPQTMKTNIFSTNVGGKSTRIDEMVRPPHKTELLDYSAFLEEQIDESEPLHFIECDTQTEYSENLKGEVDPFETHSSESNPTIHPNANSSDGPAHAVRQPWTSGTEVGTQGSLFEITSETQPKLPNPMQNTMSRISKIMASQVMFQSTVETLQCAELDEIRGQIEEITQWIAQDNIRKYEEHKLLCMRIQQEKMDEEFEAQEELKMKEVESKVGVNLFAQNYIHTLFERGLTDLQKDGTVRGDKFDFNVDKSVDKSEKAEEGTVDKPKKSRAGATKAWLNTNVDIYVSNKRLDRSLVDDLIVDASTKRYEDFKEFLEGPDAASSLQTEETTESKDTTDAEMTDPEVEDPVDDDDGEDDKALVTEDKPKVSEPENGPKVIKLMENNPQFNYKDAEQD